MNRVETARLRASQALEDRKDVAGGYLVGLWDGQALRFDPAPVIEAVQPDPTPTEPGLEDHPLVAVTIWTGNTMSVLMVEATTELVIEYRG